MRSMRARSAAARCSAKVTSSSPPSSTHRPPSGLSPYVRYHYWAEVQLPPERRLPPGVAEVPLPAGSIEPTQPAQSQDAPGAYSAVSAPAVAMFVPAEVPALAADMVTATVGAGAVAGTWRLTLSVAGGPVAHVRAVGPFRVRLHLQVDGGDWTPEPGDTGADRRGHDPGPADRGRGRRGAAVGVGAGVDRPDRPRVGAR